MKKKTLISTLLTGLFAIVIATSVQAKEYKLRFGYETPRSDSQHIAAEYWNKLLQERTKDLPDQISLRLFPDSQLGSGPAMVSGTRQGTIDLQVGGTNNFSGLAPRLDAFDIPFLFRNANHAYAVLDGSVGDDVLKDLNKVGLQGLAFWENGWRDLTNSRRAVHSVDDVKGLKVRTSSSPVLIEAFRIWGANPSPMPLSELYTALETGAMDAQEHPLNVTYGTKLYEVQKYISLTHHTYSSVVVVMNKKKFDSLSPELQKILIETAKEAGEYQRKFVADSIEKMISDMEASGIQVIRDVDTDSFRNALGDRVRDIFSQKVEGGAELLKAVDAVQE